MRKFDVEHPKFTEEQVDEMVDELYRTTEPAFDSEEYLRQLIVDCPVKPGQFYRHYKGNLYFIVLVVINECSLSPLIIYELASSSKDTTPLQWSRTLHNFLSNVSPNQKRFTLVDPSEVGQGSIKGS